MKPSKARTEKARASALRPFELVERIVVPVEGSDREFVVQQWAAELAAGLSVPLTAIHVSQGGRESPPDVFRYLERVCREHGVALETSIRDGQDVAATLADDLETRDLVVIGTERMGPHFKVGSVTAGLIRVAPCPVQVVRLP